jgi:TonB-linked SusC/RagA family outer membrane protein
MMKKMTFLIVGLFLTVCFAAAQTQTVKGIVTDETGEPIIGASVRVKGTTIGIITDTDGKFGIQIPENVKILTFSFLGYESADVAVKPDMRVTLKTSATALEEVVVTGVSQMDKRLFTGATDQLKADEIRLGGMPDISRALEGRSAGVTVQNITGTFGTAPKIRVRGATSIYGSSKPLWVVDGIIMEDIAEVSADALSSGDAITLISSAIAGLNAEDIESFQILKDGSATSIYGARAMSGVIVVTTKKGQAGKNRINYTGEFTSRLVPDYGEFNIMNSQEQMGVYQELEAKGWLNYAETYRDRESGVYGQMYHLLNQVSEGGFGLLNLQEVRNRYLQEAEMRNTDWFSELFRPSIMQNHSVSISSGTEKASTYASISALIDPGWSLQSSVNRYTANVNTSYKIFNNLSLNMISNASYRKQKAPGTLAQSIDVVAGEVKRDFDINPYSYAMNTSRTLDPNVFYTRNYAPFNIIDELDNNYIDIGVVDMKFQGEVKWRVFSDLELSAIGAVKYNTVLREHHVLDDANQAQAYRAMGDATTMDRNPLLYNNPDEPFSYPISVLPQGGIYRNTSNKMLAYDFRTQFNWSKVFNDTHITHILGGMQLNSVSRGETFFNGWGLQYSKGETPFYVYEFFKKGIEENNQYYSLNNTVSRYVSFFANPTYSYKGKYSLQLTWAYEGNNRLGRSIQARWLPTWNIGGAWNIHEESFFDAVRPILTHATLRGSYSLTADAPKSVSNAKSIIKNYNPWRPFANVKESGLQQLELANEDLTYEKKHELNIGGDFGFLSNRINLSIDVFRRNNYDLIGPVITQGVGGQNIKLANVASMKSHGVELTLSTKNFVKKDFSWNTDFLFAYTPTEVTKLDQQSQIIDLITGTGFAVTGYADRALFSIPFKGLDAYGLPLFLDQDEETTTTGIYFQERDKVDFLIYEGPSNPTISGSFGNIFQYQHLRLNVFVTYSGGNKIRLDPVFKSEYSDLTATPREFKNRWMMPGDENITNIPKILTNREFSNDRGLSYGYNAYNYSDVRIADGSFVRLKEVSLTYDFPKQLLDVVKVDNLSLRLQASNLLLLYADKKLNGQDPEFFRSGGVSAPVPKQFTLTLRLGL